MSFASSTSLPLSSEPFRVEVLETSYELESRTATWCGVAATVSLALLVALLVRLRGAKSSPHPAFGLGPGALLAAFFGLVLALSGPGGCTSAHAAKVVFKDVIRLEQGIGYAGIVVAVTILFVLIFAAIGDDPRSLVRGWPIALPGFLTSGAAAAFALRHAAALGDVGELPHVRDHLETDAHVDHVVEIPWVDPEASRWRLDRHVRVTDVGGRVVPVHAYHRTLGIAVTEQVKVRGHVEESDARFPLRVGARWRFAKWTESQRSASHYFLFWGDRGSHWWSVSQDTAEIWVDGTRDRGPLRTFDVVLRDGDSVSRVEVVAMDGDTWLWDHGKKNQRFVTHTQSELAPGIVPCELHGLGHFYCQVKAAEPGKISIVPTLPSRKGVKTTPTPPRPWTDMHAPAAGPVGWARDHGSSSGVQSAIVAVLTLGMVLEGSTHTYGYARLVAWEAGDPLLGEALAAAR